MRPTATLSAPFMLASVKARSDPGNIVVLDPHSGSLVGNYSVEQMLGGTATGDNFQVTEDGVVIQANAKGIPGSQPDPADPANNFLVPSVLAVQNEAVKYDVIAMPEEKWTGASITWKGAAKHFWRVPSGGFVNGHGQWVYRAETYGSAQSVPGWFEVPGGLDGLPSGLFTRPSDRTLLDLTQVLPHGTSVARQRRLCPVPASTSGGVIIDGGIPRDERLRLH